MSWFVGWDLKRLLIMFKIDKADLVFNVKY